MEEYQGRNLRHDLGSTPLSRVGTGNPRDRGHRCGGESETDTSHDCRCCDGQDSTLVVSPLATGSGLHKQDWNGPNWVTHTGHSWISQVQGWSGSDVERHWGHQYGSGLIDGETISTKEPSDPPMKQRQESYAPKGSPHAIHVSRADPESELMFGDLPIENTLGE